MLKQRSKSAKARHYFNRVGQTVNNLTVHVIDPKVLRRLKKVKVKPGPVITLREFDSLVRDGNQTIKEKKDESEPTRG